MKKCKLLLTGKGRLIINDFFYQTDFECLSTSIRFEDVVGHIKYYKPNVFIYCIQNEENDDINRMKTLKQIFKTAGIPVVIIGDRTDCEEFDRMVFGAADLQIYRPVGIKEIEEKVTKLCQEKGILKATDAAAGESKKEEAPAAKPQEGPAHKHILVVDDDVRMLKVVKEHLKGEYDVATAINGKLALKFLENKKTDLILLDYVMPGESGPEVFQKLRANPATKDIPILFVTGVDDLGKIREVLKLKPEGYLLKPIDRTKLLESVNELLG